MQNFYVAFNLMVCENQKIKNLYNFPTMKFMIQFGQGTSVETYQTIAELDIGNGMSLSISYEGDNFSLTGSCPLF